MPRIEIEHFEQVEDSDERSAESFDRLAFAERAIALVRPPLSKVAICPGARRVRVEAGRQWGGGDGARWAVVSVPPDASRRAIAAAVLGLYAGEQPPLRAWALDVLMAELGGGSSPLRRFGAPSERG